MESQTPLTTLIFPPANAQALLSAPNPDDPLANDVADHWKTDEAGAVRTGAFDCAAMDGGTAVIWLTDCWLCDAVAAEWTRRYA